jgi:GTP-binding protein
MFKDEAVIVVRAGDGGNGGLAWRREKYVPEGGPAGGDGGDGGDVILVGSSHMNTLMLFNRKRHWKAEHGDKGGADLCSGKGGEDLEIKVPCGTIVRNLATGEIIADLVAPDQRVIVAAGGIGGKGNARFKSSVNQTPRQTTPGTRGVELELKLELKLIADVGIIGYPNAGKSTLLSRLSKAMPKIAAYPFTTLEPQLGVIERDDRVLVLADIPGLIEGAADGKGLGHQFLRHVERCPVFVHLVDGSEGTVTQIAKRIAVLNKELQRFSPELAAKQQLVVLNKSDTRADLPALAAKLGTKLKTEVVVISGVSGQGIPELADRLFRFVDAARAQ